MLKLYASMWIALYVWMKVLMNLLSSVELERLLLNGLPGLRQIYVLERSNDILLVFFTEYLVS